MSDGFSCPTTTNNPLSEHIDACQLIDNEIDLELGKLPIGWNISDTQNETVFITDYVANGSFASLAENVTYNHEPDFAVLIRLTDFNNSFNGNFVYVNEHSYNFLRKSKLYGGEIIISNVGAYSGTVFFAPKLNRPMTLGPNSIMMNFINGNEFYYYWFRSPIGKFLLEGIISGSAQPKFNKTLFRKLKVPVPPLPEQKAIAAVLSSLDDKIDLLHRQNKTLEAMAETLFRQWFIEEAKEDWEVKTLGSLGDVITGKTPSKDNNEHWGNDIEFITPTDFKNYGKYIGSADRHLSLSGKNKFQNLVIPRNSIVITCIGSDMGKVAITDIECITNQQINSLVIKSKIDNIEYVYQYLKSIYPLLRNMALGGTTMPIINKTDFSNIEIPIPTGECLEKFHSITLSFNEKILNNTSQIQTLEKLRDNLLPKLMSGEVRVSYEQQDAA